MRLSRWSRCWAASASRSAAGGGDLGAAALQRGGDGADAPGRAYAGAADHYGAGAGGVEHGARVLDAAAVAVDDHRDFHRGDDLPHRRASPRRPGRTGIGCAHESSPCARRRSRRGAPAPRRCARNRPSRAASSRVTGTSEAATTAARMRSAASRSRISALPASAPATLRAGQPILTSTRSTPSAASRRAASAIAAGSRPTSCTANVAPATRSARSLHLVVVRQQRRRAHHLGKGKGAPRRCAARRIPASVTPAIGARKTRPWISRLPSRNGASNSAQTLRIRHSAYLMTTRKGCASAVVETSFNHRRFVAALANESRGRRVKGGAPRSPSTVQGMAAMRRPAIEVFAASVAWTRPFPQLSPDTNVVPELA